MLFVYKKRRKSFNASFFFLSRERKFNVTRIKMETIKTIYMIEAITILIAGIFCST